jgi:hypothetical protein
MMVDRAMVYTSEEISRKWLEGEIIVYKNFRLKYYNTFCQPNNNKDDGDHIILTSLVDSREVVFAIYLTTLTTKILDFSDEHKMIWSIISLRDGTIAVGHESEIIVHKD